MKEANKAPPTLSVRAKVGIRAQRDYCNRKKIPMFMPSDSVCFRCNYSVFEGGLRSVSLEYSAFNLITSCPNCQTSFVN